LNTYGNSKANQERLALNAAHVWTSVLGVKADDSLLILTDVGAQGIGCAFFQGACRLGFQPAFIIIPPISEQGGEPPKLAAEALRTCDVFVVSTSAGSKSMTHTRARRAACEAGARGLTLPRATEELLARPAVTTDYRVIAQATEALAAYLNGTRQLCLYAENGTELVFDVHGSTWFAERGLCVEPGQFSNLPGGEVSISPVNAEGVLVVDASFSGLGKLRSPLVLKIKDRRVISIEGEHADELIALLQPFGDDAFNIAEIGIGMNPAARLCGYVLEDEKVLGTVHVGLGDNANMGGKTLGKIVSCGIHVDGVIAAHPQLFADGELVIPERFFDITKGGLHE